VNARHLVLLLSIAALGGVGGALAYRMVWAPDSQHDLAMLAAPATAEAAADVVGARRPDYTLGSDSGAWVSASDFDGQVVLVNFWATWCQPCREEMPMLLDLQHDFGQQGLQVVGIALDDVQQARDFVSELGVDYPILVGAVDVMAVARLYGNVSGVLPYSVLIDRAGIIRWAQLGALQRDELVQRLGALLH
jgi:thiol-disulfide isomerase/thioredoxin